MICDRVTKLILSGVVNKHNAHQNELYIIVNEYVIKPITEYFANILHQHKLNRKVNKTVIDQIENHCNVNKTMEMFDVSDIYHKIQIGEIFLFNEIITNEDKINIQKSTKKICEKIINRKNAIIYVVNIGCYVTRIKQTLLMFKIYGNTMNMIVVCVITNDKLIDNQIYNINTTEKKFYTKKINDINDKLILNMMVGNDKYQTIQHNDVSGLFDVLLY